jgi:hypothetical protein
MINDDTTGDENTQNEATILRDGLNVTNRLPRHPRGAGENTQNEATIRTPEQSVSVVLRGDRLSTGETGDNQPCHSITQRGDNVEDLQRDSFHKL